MCNRLHLAYTPIKPDGKGYKIFSDVGNEYLRGCFCDNIYTTKDGWAKIGEWITWCGEPYQGISGFCFFLEKVEAVRCVASILKETHTLDNWRDRLVVREIDYKGGLGKQWEENLKGGYTFEIALAKEFRIVEKEN